MLTFPEYCFPYLIDSVTGPVVPKFSWFYDAKLNDILMRPIRLLEETIGPTVLVRINGFTFNVPASWYLLVVDEETKLVDTVQITQCSSSGYSAFMVHPTEGKYSTSPIMLLDLFMKESCVHVMIPKMHMMLHPVGPVTDRRNDEKIYSVLLSPQDVGKNMDNMTAMELLM